MREGDEERDSLGLRLRNAPKIAPCFSVNGRRTRRRTASTLKLSNKPNTQQEQPTAPLQCTPAPVNFNVHQFTTPRNPESLLAHPSPTPQSFTTNCSARSGHYHRIAAIGKGHVGGARAGHFIRTKGELAVRAAPRATTWTRSRRMLAASPRSTRPPFSKMPASSTRARYHQESAE